MSLCQFYTNPDVARSCVDTLKKHLRESGVVTPYFVEPSAGEGAFYDLLPEQSKIGIDIAPKSKAITKCDFFDFNMDLLPDEKSLVFVGNPPFGKMANLAIKFFNRAAEKAEIIAFVVPKTFRKNSVHDKLNLSFHLKKDVDLPPNAFIYNGKPHDVPCVFQIWARGEVSRKIIRPCDLSHLFEFTDKNNADIAIRRVGGRSGVILDGMEHSPTTTYFIKVREKSVLDALRAIDFSDVCNNTVGPKSLSKSEILSKVSSQFGEKQLPSATCK